MAGNDDWGPGDIVIDGSGNVAQKSLTGDCWFVLGWIDQGWSYSDLDQPVRKLVPAEYPEAKGGADPFLYRLSYANGSVKHGSRRVMSNAVSRTNSGAPNYQRGQVVKVEREAVPAVWEDVTDRFLKGR